MKPPAALVEELLEAIEARSLERVLSLFAPDATWQNVPHPPVVGHEGIGAMLGPILERSSEVRWEIVTAAYDTRRAWVERIDRFWIDDVEYAVRCNGVFEVARAAEAFTSVRDYVDLGEWRTRLASAGPLGRGS